MLKVAAIIYIILAPVLAGSAILAVFWGIEQQTDSIAMVGYAALAGFVLAIPLSFVVASMLLKRFSGPKAA